MERKNKITRVNQVVCIHYENPRSDGHIITVMDSYRNFLGRIHEKFDEQSQKFEYTFCDKEGKPVFRNERLEDLKREFSKHKEKYFEIAHQDRLAKLQETRESMRVEKVQEKKIAERKFVEKQNNRLEKSRQVELQHLREAKSNEKSQSLEK